MAGAYILRTVVFLPLNKQLIRVVEFHQFLMHGFSPILARKTFEGLLLGCQLFQEKMKLRFCAHYKFMTKTGLG